MGWPSPASLGDAPQSGQARGGPEAGWGPRPQAHGLDGQSQSLGWGAVLSVVLRYTSDADEAEHPLYLLGSWGSVTFLWASMSPDSPGSHRPCWPVWPAGELRAQQRLTAVRPC